MNISDELKENSKKKLNSFGSFNKKAFAKASLLVIRAIDKTSSRYLFKIIAIIYLVVQLAIVVSFLWPTLGTRPQIYAIDNDAGAAIETAVRTRIYNNNGFTAYGPNYYRAAKLLTWFMPTETFIRAEDRSAGLDRDEQYQLANERKHHFALLLVSFFALAAISYLIVSLLSPVAELRVFGTILLLGSFLKIPVFSEMIFRAHPDHLFALFVVIASLLSLRSLIQPESKWRFRWAAMAWGIAASSKMAVLFFAPLAVGWLLLGLSRNGILKSAYIKIRDFVSYALGAYLLIGFPQNFNFYDVLSFLAQQKSRNVHPGDWNSFVGWLELFWSQFQGPLYMVVGLALILSILSPWRESPIHGMKSRSFRFWSLVYFIGWLPLVWLVSRKVTSAFYWYVLPFVMSQLAILAFFLGCFLREKIYLASISQRVKAWVSLPLFLTLFWVFPPLPQNLEAQQVHQLNCRNEINSFQGQVIALVKRGSAVVADPYSPYPMLYHDKQVNMTWDMNWNYVFEKGAQVLALKKDYYSIYIPKDMGGAGEEVHHLSNPQLTAEFFKAFWQKDVAVDPKGRAWKKTYSDSCSYEIWSIQ